MPKSYKEAGVSIPATEAAIVTASDMTELELILPQEGDYEGLPEAAQFLTACALRYHADPPFVAAQLAWLKKHKAGSGE